MIAWCFGVLIRLGMAAVLLLVTLSYAIAIIEKAEAELEDDK